LRSIQDVALLKLRQNSTGKRNMPSVRYIVYHPPQAGYPFLAVALSPTGEVSAVAYDTAREAEVHNAARATEAARSKPRGQDA
jgi:hypothetical protein